MDSTMETQVTYTEEDRFNESIITLLIHQQDLQKQSWGIMKNVTRWHEHDSLMRDITIVEDDFL